MPNLRWYGATSEKGLTFVGTDAGGLIKQTLTHPIWTERVEHSCATFDDWWGIFTDAFADERFMVQLHELERSKYGFVVVSTRGTPSVWYTIFTNLVPKGHEQTLENMCRHMYRPASQYGGVDGIAIVISSNLD